ncbi:TPA: hypothetical protein N0F65_004099 [Lagenidium giganteum]|uniref:Uncharacterized protein n=1 Tax=Lagenidium giganteum TaxID=4803 RepID=A0AAV2ZA84_9STRA|nr:TPA: hypothetical protein N0F65_004099 [Lagenidium giganteum]
MCISRGGSVTKTPKKSRLKAYQGC